MTGLRSSCVLYSVDLRYAVRHRHVVFVYLQTGHALVVVVGHHLDPFCGHCGDICHDPTHGHHAYRGIDLPVRVHDDPDCWSKSRPRIPADRHGTEEILNGDVALDHGLDRGPDHGHARDIRWFGRTVELVSFYVYKSRRSPRCGGNDSK